MLNLKALLQCHPLPNRHLDVYMKHFVKEILVTKKPRYEELRVTLIFFTK